MGVDGARALDLQVSARRDLQKPSAKTSSLQVGAWEAEMPWLLGFGQVR
jgi:hypothetical protein